MIWVVVFGVLALIIVVAFSVAFILDRRDRPEVALRRKVQAADAAITDAHRAARQEMNRIAGQEWRNMVD